MYSFLYRSLEIAHHPQSGCGSRLTISELGDGNCYLSLAPGITSICSMVSGSGFPGLLSSLPPTISDSSYGSDSIELGDPNLRPTLSQRTSGPLHLRLGVVIRALHARIGANRGPVDRRSHLQTYRQTDRQPRSTF